MITKIKTTDAQKTIPDVRPGDTVRVYQVIKEAAQPGKKVKKEEEKKEKIQVFEGLVLARKHGSEPGATITVRKVIDGVGVEKIFPLHSPLVKKFEITKRGKARRAKLYYLRETKGKRARLRTEEFRQEMSEEPDATTTEPKNPEAEIDSLGTKENKQNNEGEPKE